MTETVGDLRARELEEKARKQDKKQKLYKLIAGLFAFGLCASALLSLKLCGKPEIGRIIESPVMPSVNTEIDDLKAGMQKMRGDFDAIVIQHTKQSQRLSAISAEFESVKNRKSVKLSATDSTAEIKALWTQIDKNNTRIRGLQKTVKEMREGSPPVQVQVTGELRKQEKRNNAPIYTEQR